MQKRSASPRLGIDPPQPIPRVPGGRQAVAFSLVDRWATHPGHGLTPRRVVEIFREAEAGFPQRQCDLFEDVIETDAHLFDKFHSRIDAVSGKDWITQAGGDEEVDRVAAKALEDALRSVPNFGECVEHLLTFNGYGYAGAGVDWAFVDGLYRPVWFRLVPHRRFIFDEADRPRVLVDIADTKGQPLEPGSFIWMNRRGRLQARAGLMRVATWWALFKRLSVRDWVVLAERFGLPYVTGEYSEEATDADKAALKQAVLDLGKDGAAVFAQACKIVVHQVQAGKSEDVHGAIVALCNQEISKLFNGSTLTSETGGPGSFALGKVHENRSFSITISDENKLGNVLQQQLGAAFVSFNGFPVRRPPRTRHQIAQMMDPAARTDQMDKARNKLGLDLDEDQVRWELHLKKPAPGAGVLKGAPLKDPNAPAATPPASSE